MAVSLLSDLFLFTKAPEGLTPLVEWEWWSNFMPWLILVQVKGAMAHPVYQVVASVRLKVPWASHGEQFTKNSVTPPLLLHQWGLTLDRPVFTCFLKDK